MGERKSFRLRSVRPTTQTKVSVLGADGKILEYRPDVDASPRWRGRRRGPGARHHDGPAAVQRPQVAQPHGGQADPRRGRPQPARGRHRARPASAPGTSEALLVGDLRSLGQAPAVEVGFEYRRRKQVEELLNADAPWRPTVAGAAAGPRPVQRHRQGPGPPAELRVPGGGQAPAAHRARRGEAAGRSGEAFRATRGDRRAPGTGRRDISAG